MKDQIKLDFNRPARVGFDEAILAAGKSTEQLTEIVEQVLSRDERCLITRLKAPALEQLPAAHRDRLDYDPVSRTAYLNWTAPEVTEPRPHHVAVVSAGSSDMPQAAEALRTLAYFGAPAHQFIDVGVAGLWRLLERVDELRTFPVVIAVAGMDGALPSVLGGLVPGAIICLPTSTGYGVSHQGETALHAALASCAPGLTVVNIDNGYGAACAAFRILRCCARDHFDATRFE